VDSGRERLHAARIRLLLQFPLRKKPGYPGTSYNHNKSWGIVLRGDPFLSLYLTIFNQPI
jgi:hypothetical protein